MVNRHFGGDVSVNWIGRVCTTDRMFPRADKATKAERSRSAWGPYTFLKSRAATRRPEFMISSFGAPAKYAMLASMYRTATTPRASGPAMRIVRAGFFTSDSA